MAAGYLDYHIDPFLAAQTTAEGHIGALGGGIGNSWSVEGVGDDDEFLGGEAGGDEFAALEVGDAGEDVDAVEVVAAQSGHGVAGGVAEGFEEGVLAVVAHAAPFVAPFEAELAGGAVAHEKARGADEAEVVDGHHDGDSGPTALAEGGGGDEGVEVVDVDYVGTLAPQGLAHGPDAGWAPESGGESADFAGDGFAGSSGRHTELGDVVALAGKHYGHLVDDGLLAGVFAVVVMYEQDFHCLVSPIRLAGLPAIME